MIECFDCVLVVAFKNLEDDFVQISMFKLVFKMVKKYTWYICLFGQVEQMLFGNKPASFGYRHS